MSLSLNQFLSSPNKEKKIFLPSQLKGDESSEDNCFEEDKINTRKISSQKINLVNYKTENENKINEKTYSKNLSQSKNINQSKNYKKQKNYEYNFSNQLTDDTNYKQENMSNNLNYSLNNQLTNHKNKSSQHQNEMNKGSRAFMNYEDYSDQQSFNEDTTLFNDNYIKNDTKQITDKDDLNNGTSASALIKKGNLFKNIDYFNKTNCSFSDYDKELYNNRKVERRKIRKNSIQNFNDLIESENNFTPNQEASYSEKKNEIQNKETFNKYNQLMNEKQFSENLDNYQNRTRFVNKKRNYHHYIQKDSNSKRASISSAEISKYDTFSSSSSASPTQDQKIDINELNCSKNNYVGYNIDDVINIDNINKKKNIVQKNIFYSSNNSLIDETINENFKTQKNSNHKISKLNDLIRCDNDILSSYNTNPINGELDLIGNSEFSSNFMHKSASTSKIPKNNSIETKYDNQRNKNFELADLCQDTLKEFSNVDNFYNVKNNIEVRDYQFSPELLKFNDIEFDNNSKENKCLDLPQNNNENISKQSFYDKEQNYSKTKDNKNNLQKLNPNDKNNKNLIDELENEFIKNINDSTISLNNQIFENKNESLLSDLVKNENFEDENDTKDSELNVCISKSLYKKENNKEQNDLQNTMSYSNELKKSFQMNCENLDLEIKDSFNDYFNSSNQELTSPVRNTPKTPGYTQRVLNHSNKDQIKYDLFQLGTPNNNMNSCLIDIDKNEETDNSEETKNNFIEHKALDENTKNVSHSLNNLKDISRDDLVKSILNIPYSNYDCLDQNEETKSQNYISQTKKLNNQVKKVFDSLEKLNISDNNIKTSNVVGKNDTKINNNFISGYDKSKDNNSSIENSTVVNKSISKNRVNSSDSKKSRNSCNLINNLDNFNSLISSENSKMKETSVSENNEMNDCLDLSVDKIETKNLNFESTNVKNNISNEKTKILIKTNGLISNPNENETNSDSYDKSSHVKNNKIDKDLDKNEYLIDTENFELISEESKTSDKNYKKQYSSQCKKEQPFGQHQIKSKILQDTVTNHLLNESLIDVNDNNLFEPENIFDTTKKSPKKQKNSSFSENNYLESNRQVDKHYSHNLVNSKYNTQNKNNDETMRNFSLSPETTDCESVEVESEFSMSSFMSIPGLNQMPILEDGLSSGSASDNEISQNFKIENEHIFKKPVKQQNESSESPKSELFAKCRPRNKKNEQRHSDYDLSIEKDLKYYNNYDKCDNSNPSSKHNLCNEQITNDNRQQVMKKSRSLFNSTSNSMNASLNNGLLTDSSEAEHSTHPHSNEISSKQLWNSKLQQQLHQPQQQQNRGHYNQSNIGCENQNGENDTGNSLLKLNDDKPKLIEKTFHEDDCDTDQETDRLLGAQRSEDRTFYEEKNPPIKKKSNSKEGSKIRPNLSRSVLIEGVLFRARYLGSTQLICEGQPTKATRMMQAEEAVSRIKAPEGETQPSTEVDLFISTEKIMVLNTDLKEIMMDHTLRTISYIADIGDLLVLMARRRQQIIPSNNDLQNNVLGIDKIKRTTPKMICHVFESEEAQFIAQSIGQAFQVAYMEFLKANGIEDSSFVKEMDYQEVLNSQEIFGNELEMFARKEKQKEVIVPKKKGEILGMVIVESGWGSMLPTVVIANMAQQMPASRCGALNIGDQIIAINGISLVGLPLAACQQYIKNTKIQTVVKLTVVPCAPVVEVKIKRPDTKYQLGFSVQNGVICSLLRGGIAERGGVRVGHRIIEINGQSVVAVPHEKIVNLLATSVGEIHMKTMPTSMFRLLTGQETPMFI